MNNNCCSYLAQQWQQPHPLHLITWQQHLQQILLWPEYNNKESEYSQELWKRGILRSFLRFHISQYGPPRWADGRMLMKGERMNEKTNGKFIYTISRPNIKLQRHELSQHTATFAVTSNLHVQVKSWQNF